MGRHEHEASSQLTLPLSRTEMADYLGLRLETVSRQLKQLEIAGAIKRVDPRRISVADAERLAGIAGPARRGPA